MKKLFVLAALVVATIGVSALAENGVVVVRTNTEEALEPTLLDTAEQINNRTYPRHKYNDNCDHLARRSVYAIDVGGKAYRRDRFGNLHPYWHGAVKYRCR